MVIYTFLNNTGVNNLGCLLMARIGQAMSFWIMRVFKSENVATNSRILCSLH
jgi:hypothetical protein